MEYYVHLSHLMVILVAALVSWLSELITGENHPSDTNLPFLEILRAYNSQVIYHSQPNLSLDTSPSEDLG